MSLIDVKQISPTQIQAALQAFQAARPGGAQWQDYFRDPSSGFTIMEAMAGVDAHLQYHTVAGRREAYLLSAQLRSSIIGMVEFLGYSAGKGQRNHWSLTFVPNTNGTLTPFQDIGTIKGFTVVNLKLVTVTNGVPITIDVAIGNLDQENIVVPSAQTFYFRFTSPSVSEDYQILKNNVVMPQSKSILDLANDKYVALSNPLGAVDVFYLNTGNFQYTTGDTISLQFVDFGDDIPTPLFTDLTLFVGTATAIVPNSAEPRAEQESNSSMITNAPLRHETSNVVRGRNDFLKLLKQLDVGFSSTNGTDITPAVVELTYCRNDRGLLTLDQKNTDLNALLQYRPFGVQPPQISDPIEIDFNMTITLTGLPGVTQPALLSTDINTIVNQQALQLGILFDLGDTESAINQLKNDVDQVFIKSVRITLTDLWTASSNYKVSKILQPATPNGFYYKSIQNITQKWTASTVISDGQMIISSGANGYGSVFVAVATIAPGTTASVEPNWAASAPSVGNTVVDGFVTWMNIGPSIPYWVSGASVALNKALTPVTFTSFTSLTYTGSGLNDAVISGSYTARSTGSYVIQIDSVGLTDTFRWSRNGGTTWQQQHVHITGLQQALEFGLIVTFGNITGHTITDQWIFSAYNYYFKRISNIRTTWQGTNPYAVGARVVPTVANGFAFQCTVAGTSAVSQPSWPLTIGATVVDGGVTWQNIGAVIPLWKASFAYSLNTIIEAVANPGVYFKATTAAGSSGGTEPTWDTVVGHTTTDGGITWTCVAAGVSGATEPSWNNLSYGVIADNTILWGAEVLGNSGSTPPSFPVTPTYLVADETSLWQNIGPTSSAIQLNWSEYAFVNPTLVLQ